MKPHVAAVFLLGFAGMWMEVVCQVEGGDNVCHYKAAENVEGTKTIKENCNGDSCTVTTFTSDEVVKYKCCEGWYVSADGKNCNTPICHERRDELAGTCKNNGTCNKPGECQCLSEGFYQFDCSDMDECSFMNADCSNFCTNTIGSYYCHCPPGYGLDSDMKSCYPSCGDYTPAGRCPHRGRCVAPDQCQCVQGREGIDCADINECEVLEPDCENGCVNTEGGYYCACKDGYGMTPFGECEAVCFDSFAGTCPNGGRCVKPGQCECEAGYGGPKCSPICFHIQPAGKCKNGHKCESPNKCSCPEGFNQTDCEDIDECKNLLQTNCSFGCVNTVGGYHCACQEGYGRDSNGDCKATCLSSPPGECPNGGTCVEPGHCRCGLGYAEPDCADINECHVNNGGCDQVCENLNGTHNCSCRPGYAFFETHSRTGWLSFIRTDTEICQPICYTSSIPGKCLNDQPCTAPDTCSCSAGFEPPDCKDIDECEASAHDCEQICSNKAGGYDCSCDDQYELSSDGKSCIPFCHSQEAGWCPNGGTCVRPNECQCQEGFRSPDCEDTDECQLEIDECEQICNNTHGSYSCSCEEGHELAADSKSCTPLCYGEEAGLCPNNGRCLEPDKCQCPSGTLPPRCDDINECDDDATLCDQTCKNVLGSYYCACEEGYQLAANNNSCNPVCFNQPFPSCPNGGTCEGRDKCSCTQGFRAPDCRDIDECSEADDLNELCEQECVNTPGSYRCECSRGYGEDEEGNCKAACGDVPAGKCLNGGICTEPGVCQCAEGYEGELCKDPAFCNIDNGGCSHDCVNIDGGHLCACPVGYKLVDNTTCSDVDECADDDDNACNHLCKNTEGSYTCHCREGFNLTGSHLCLDINECANNVCGDKDCKNTPGSHECVCPETTMTDLKGQCIEIKLCGQNEDPETMNCAPLCSGRPNCTCPDYLQLHTNGKHCVDPCTIKPCQHNGICKAIWDGSYRCDCFAARYTGRHCEKGLIIMPSELRARAGQVYQNIWIDARPEEDLELWLVNSDKNIKVTPNPILVRQRTKFDLLIQERGIYNVTLNIKGTSAADYESQKSISVRTDDVFSRLQLRNSLLPSGCFWFLLNFQSYKLWFSSTSHWYQIGAAVYTEGVVTLVHNTLELPISRDGVEIVADSKIRLNAVKTDAAATKLENHKHVPCDVLSLSDRDMMELQEARSIFWSFFKNLEKIVPYYMQMSPVNSKAIKTLPFKPEILAGEAVQQQDICRGAPTMDDRLYLVFRFKDPFIMTILEEKFTIEEGDFCIIVDMLTDEGNTVTFMFSDDAGARISHLPLVQSMEKVSTLNFSFTGFSVSPPGRIRLPPASQELQFWNGARMFSYPFDDKAIVWAKMLATRDTEDYTKTFSMKMKGTVQAFMSEIDPDSVFTHLFVKPRDVYLQLDTFSMEMSLNMLGKRFTFVLRDFLRRNQGVIGMGGGGLDRSYCGASANPPGAFFYVTVEERVLEGIPVLENLVLGTGDDLLYFKSFKEGMDRGGEKPSWNNETSALLNNMRNTTEAILSLMAAATLPPTASSNVSSLVRLITVHARNISEEIIAIMKSEYAISTFADFTKTTTTHVAQLHSTFLSLKDLLSIRLDRSLDNTLIDLETLVLDVRDKSVKVVRQLYDISLPYFPDQGRWGLKGTLGATILGMYIGIEGELVISDDGIMPCKSRFSDFYKHLGGDNSVRLLGMLKARIPTVTNIRWGPLFWKYLVPTDGYGVELAISTTRVAFVCRLHVQWSLLGIKASGDLFISTKGIHASVEGNLWNIFRARLTVGAEYSTTPKDWEVWMQADFLPGGDDSFEGSLWDAVRKAAQQFGKSASERLKAGERAMVLAQHALAATQKKVEAAKDKVRAKNSAFDAAVAKMEKAKDNLEKAKAPFQAANAALTNMEQKLERLCQIKTCDKICMRGLVLSRCKFLWSKNFPCLKINSCAFKIHRPSCLASNVLCRVRRGLVYASVKVAKAAVRIPMIALDLAKATVTATQVVVDKSRIVLAVAEGVLEGTKYALKGAEIIAAGAEKAFAALRKTLQGGLALLDAFVKNTLKNIIDFKTCGFKNSITAADGVELKVYCEVNFMNSGWKKHVFVINFKNAIGSLWKLAKTYLTKAMQRFSISGRRRREVEREAWTTLHRIYRREAGTQQPNLNSSDFDDIIDTSANFWELQCKNYKPSITFIRKSLEFLSNISAQVYTEAEEAEVNTTAYFDKFNLTSHIQSSGSSADSDAILNEYGISQDDVDNAVTKNSDDVMVKEFEKSILEIHEDQRATIREFKNEKIIVLWKMEMESYTQETLAANNDCQHFTDCLLFALADIKYMLDSVDIELVEDSANLLPAFEGEIKSLLENDTQIAEEMPQISFRLLQNLLTVDASDIFCGTVPIIAEHPKNTSAVLGENTTLTCIADSVPPAKYYWYKGDTLIPSTNRSTLQFLFTTLSDEGEFKCMAETHVGSVNSTVAILNVVYGPSFIGSWPTVMRVSFGDNTSLFCNVSANPEADIVWYSTDTNLPVSTDRVLILGKLADKTSALYKCVANNSYGQAESHETVVHVNPGKAACPSVAMKAKFGSKTTSSNGGASQLASVPPDASFPDKFKTAFMSEIHERFPSVDISIVAFNEVNRSIEVRISHKCDNISTCSGADCNKQHEEMTTTVRDGLDSLIQATVNEKPLFAHEGKEFYLTKGKTTIGEMEEICPAGHTSGTLGRCAPNDNLILQPPTGLNVELINGSPVLRWNPPPYADNFVKGYQITLRSKVDGKTMTFNVTGTKGSYAFEGNFQPEEYDIGVMAYTASYISPSAGMTFDMGQIGTKLPTDTQNSNLGVAVGVSVAFCILLIALAIIGRKLYSSKNKKTSSVASFGSTVSTDIDSTSDPNEAFAGVKSAWMPIIASDKVKATKQVRF